MSPFFTKHLRVLVGALLAGLCIVALAACGDDETTLPANAVAAIGDTAITKAQFDHWFESASKSQASQGGPAVPPDPPTYAKCIAALKKAQPKGSKPADAALKQQCKQSYDQLKQQVLQFLIQSEWVTTEAKEQGVSASPKEVRTLFEQQKKQAFPKEKDYEKFLKTSGMSESDILFRIKIETLQNKLTKKIQAEQAKVTDEDIQKYYDKNKKRFGQPATRDLNVVLTKTKAEADKAKQELDDGTAFPAVVKKYSIDQASKANGGKLPGVAQGQQEKALDAAVFAAPKGKVTGPVKTQFGWYVFEVTDTKPASQQPLKAAKETIRGLLKSEREQKKLQEFVEDFRKESKEKTKCRAGYVIDACSEFKEPKTTTTGTTAAN